MIQERLHFGNPTILRESPWGPVLYVAVDLTDDLAQIHQHFAGGEVAQRGERLLDSSFTAALQSQFVS